MDAFVIAPGWEWLVDTRRQFVPQLLKQSLALSLIRSAQGLHLAGVDV